MSKPVVFNEGIAKADLRRGDGANSRGVSSTRVSERQSHRIFQQVNENVTKNPNHSRAARNADNVDQPKVKNQNNRDNSTQPRTDTARNTDTVKNKDNSTQPRTTDSRNGDNDRNNSPASRNEGQNPNYTPARDSRPNSNQRDSDTNRPNSSPEHHSARAETHSDNQNNRADRATPRERGDSDRTSNQTQNKATTSNDFPRPNDVPRDERGKASSDILNNERGNVNSNIPKSERVNITDSTPRSTQTNQNTQSRDVAQNNLPNSSRPNTSQQNTQMSRVYQQNENIEVTVNVNRHANIDQQRQDGAVRQVLTQVLRQSDIHLNSDNVNKINVFQEPKLANQMEIPRSREVNNLMQEISKFALALLDLKQLNSETLQKVSREVSQQFREQIETSKPAFLQNTDFEAKSFKQLNISERMTAAVEIMLLHLPPDVAKNLQNFQLQEILSGLLLARGLVAGQENVTDLRNLTASQPQILPSEVSLTALRDLGQLVKILISNAISAKSTPNLDLSVQKFIRILIANNELGVLLATVGLANQARNEGDVSSRSLVLTQVYTLISRLVVEGEKAMKDAMPANSIKTILQKHIKSDLAAASVVPVFSERDGGKEILHSSKHQNTGAESSVRQFLEFNPMFIFDNSASAFDDSDDSARAQKQFVDNYQDDIDLWLKSGNHRFVKEIDFEKPVGVVVERNREAFIESSNVRVILVRDGSVQGWHFLKSFLIR